MDRGANAAWLEEIMKSRNAPALLVEVHFDDGVVRTTDAWSTIVWNGHSYLMMGDFLSISGLSETFDMTIPSVSMTFSGINQSWIAIVLEKPLIDRQVVVYKAFVDYEAHALIGEPVCIFEGRLTGDTTIDDDPLSGTCTVTVRASSEFADFMRRPGRMTNHNDMQIFFPGDNGFKMTANKNPGVQWGS
ncbi:MAG: hypothetical protein HQM06_13955 [Magnetococcales bacterium]|nr:hypothetical protein [Magnetococcales bacterium]